MEWNKKRVLVFGTGISGIGAANLLIRMGAGVLLYDGNEKLKKEEILAKLEPGAQVEVILGELSRERERAAGSGCPKSGCSHRSAPGEGVRRGGASHLGRGRTGLCSGTGPGTGHHRNQWQDDDDGASGEDYGR